MSHDSILGTLVAVCCWNIWRSNARVAHFAHQQTVAFTQARKGSRVTCAKRAARFFAQLAFEKYFALNRSAIVARDFNAARYSNA